MSKRKMLIVEVGGREYPCRATMGSMLRFKRETGMEVTELDVRQPSLLATWLWCCVSSACRADGVEFGLSLLDFCDLLTPDVLKSWALSEGGGSSLDDVASGSSEKKR